MKNLVYSVFAIFNPMVYANVENKSNSYEANRKVVKALKDAGSDFKKPHSIEHHFYCFTEVDFNLVISLGKQYGYTVAHEGRDEDEKGVFWQLDLVKKSTPDIVSIEKQSIEIEAIAEKANSNYDGWGTEVEK